MNTHVLLISGQPTPNLTPLLDPAIKPGKVIMLLSNDMQRQAEWLQKVIQPRGIKYEVVEIKDPYNIHDMQEQIFDILEQDCDESFSLNATGGTKPMSIAAYDAFCAAGYPIYYIHPESDELIWLHDKKLNSLKVADRIKLEDFLQAHGALVSDIDRSLPDSSELDAAERIVGDIEYFGKAVSKLNYLSYTARNNLKSEEIGSARPDNQALEDLLDLFEQAGSFKLSQDRLIFKDESSRFFVNGGWIEGWVYHKIRELKKANPLIQDVAYNIKIERYVERGEPIKNEIDIAYLCNNRLYIIECKTRRFKGSDSNSIGAEALYKLDTLKDITGGLKAKAMLLSLLDLDGFNRTRAHDLDIAICAGQQVKNLQSELKKLSKLDNNFA